LRSALADDSPNQIKEEPLATMPPELLKRKSSELSKEKAANERLIAELLRAEKRDMDEKQRQLELESIKAA